MILCLTSDRCQMSYIGGSHSASSPLNFETGKGLVRRLLLTHTSKQNSSKAQIRVDAAPILFWLSELPKLIRVPCSIYHVIVRHPTITSHLATREQARIIRPYWRHCCEPQVF